MVSGAKGHSEKSGIKHKIMAYSEVARDLPVERQNSFPLLRFDFRHSLVPQGRRVRESLCSLLPLRHRLKEIEKTGKLEFRVDLKVSELLYSQLMFSHMSRSGKRGEQKPDFLNKNSIEMYRGSSPIVDVFI